MLTAFEISCIRRALKLADKSQMRQEFKDSYRSMKNVKYEDGTYYTVYTKCWSALYEWDLLNCKELDSGKISLDF